MNVRMMDAVQQTKVNLLVNYAQDFGGKVEATTHLERKALVSAFHKPRQVDTFQEVEWDELAQRWGTRVYGTTRDRLFVIEMPNGWTLRPVESESMWTHVVDAQNRVRAAIYYQPSIRDISGVLYLHKRYGIVDHYLDPSDPSLRIVAAQDGAAIFHEFGRIPIDHPAYWAQINYVNLQANLWFDEELPRWRDPFAYWDA